MKHIILTTFALIATLGGVAQNHNPQIFPTPQKIEYLGGSTLYTADAVTVKKSKKLPAEGYTLTSNGKKIVIEAATPRGEFYARQTLSQLMHGDSVYNVTVSDFPTVKFRGSVEGFYGTPWSHADRISQLKFYGKNKLNTYIYGPKDDPYHRAPHWRKAYPAAEGAQIAELAKVAKENYVDFVWAIHPGGDIKWNEEDFSALLAKFNSMYDLGVRSFAIFFDDISGEGTNADRQAELLNRINAQFVKVKGDVTPLIMCPTEYNKSWANPSMEDSYLVTLGKKMDKDVQIMWTGDMVCADITDSTLDWINARIGRECYIWWNFPVTDYITHIMLQGPSYGLTPNAKGRMAGFVSNPMEHAEASKIALFGVADYTWNPEAYNPLVCWDAAIRAIMPEAPAAYRAFAIHSADMEKNGHGYRRDESWESNVEDTAAMFADFARLAAAPGEMRASGADAALLDELEPWLLQAEVLGRRGMEAIAMRRFGAGDPAVLWTLYNNGAQSEEMIKAYNGHKVGTLVLAPYVERLRAEVADMLLSGNAITNSLRAAHSSAKIFTNIDRLKDQGVQNVASVVTVAPILEQVTVEPDGYFGVEFSAVMKIDKITANIDGGGRLKLQFSDNGTDWTSKATHARFVRYFNPTGKAQTVRWSDFKIFIMPSSDNPEALTDGDLRAAFRIGEDMQITVPRASGPVDQFIALLDATQPVELWKVDKNGQKEYISTSNSYLCAEIDDQTAAFELRGAGSSICEIIWKINSKN